MASAAVVTPRRKVQNSGTTSISGSRKAQAAATTPQKDAVPSEEFPSLDFDQSNATLDALLADPLMLSVLTDESSSYNDVCALCLSLCQMAGAGSDRNSSSVLLHHGAFASTMSRVWEALGSCLQQHTDRRCRMTVARTLAITAKAAYARLRPSPLLYSQAYPSVRAIEDEVGSDVPMLLCTTAQDDTTDDGIAAACIAALGLLLGTGSSTTFGGVLEDELAVHTLHMVRAGSMPSPYAPVARSVTDLDVGVLLQELGVRIIENILAPRLLSLLDRVGRMTGPMASHHMAAALPCLTTCLVHAASVHPVTLFQTDRLTYSKRWSEWDVAGLIDVVVSSWLGPALSHSWNGPLTGTAALTALRLAHAQPTKHWVPSLCAAALDVLCETCQATTYSWDHETKLDLLATMSIASRVIPLVERTRTLIWMVEQLVTLPRTLATPVGGASLRLDWSNEGTLSDDNGSTYRRPVRMALWTEIFLGFFLDGPATTGRHAGATTPSSLGQLPTFRHVCLQAFFASPVITRIISVTAESGVSSKDDEPLRQQRDELLLACTSVAIECGRRFRVTADGTAHIATDTSNEAVQEWIALVQVVLMTFSYSVFGPISSHFLSESMSMQTAGLARYVQLLQEYLHFVGLVDASGSVALKLAVNACPPHILWDRLNESATFLSRCESSDLGCLEFSTELLDEFVNRELKEGIPSHHVRLMLLALAADQWAQGRAITIRKQLELSDNSAISVTFNMRSGRDTLLALAPKRLLEKIIKAYMPPVDADGKSKRDPLKKIATEIVRVSVASIESIALMACDWRRRFGSSPESKHIVSVAVGLLQGKTDETPMDDLMKSVMGPLCEAAVKRIQAFYESSGQGAIDQSSPVSALVTQSVRIKIKPLVSSTKQIPQPTDEFMSEYLMQLCRQIIASRIQIAIDSFPPADSLLLAARPSNWLRLAVPPQAEYKDGRLYGCHAETHSAWGQSAITSSSASDAVQLVVGYTQRRSVRFDGDDEYHICVVIKAFNMAALTIFDGLRLELGISSASLIDDSHTLAKERVESLGAIFEELIADTPLSSSAAEYKHELKSGEYVTWEVDLDSISASNALYVMPSLVYRNVPKEPDDTGVNVVGEKPTGEGSAVGAESQNGEDDFQVRQLDEAKSFRGANTETEDIRLATEPLMLPPLIVCQPCQLVFYCDRCGDMDSFRFLWFRFPFQLPPVLVVGRANPVKSNPITQKIASMSSLTWDGEAIPGGVATRLWAFLTFSGHRIFCVLTESDGSDTESQQALYFRGDNKELLHSFIGSKIARLSVVASLLPGKIAKE